MKINVGILGATGIVGQNYIALLKNHPWFKVNYLSASERSAGKTYADAIDGRWQIDIPYEIASQNVYHVEDIDKAKDSCNIIFSALNADQAPHEEQYAKKGIPVISNSSKHRHTVDIPMIIPEINHQHLDIIPIQQKNRKWNQGFIIAKPNCSLQSYMIPLFPLHKKFTIRKMLITTMQSISGAGYPGVPSLDIIDNIIPFIENEEQKSETEP